MTADRGGSHRPPRHLSDLTGPERRNVVAGLGLPEFRADQVARHWYARLSSDPARWTDLSVADREQVRAALLPEVLSEIGTSIGDGGLTRKTVWRLHDGAVVESVLMRYGTRTTACVSTQAGCGMGCVFCATGRRGLRRNLSTAEIVEQALAAARRLAAEAPDGEVDMSLRRLSNVVFMGMGEPLANYEATVRAIRVLTAQVPDGPGMSARALTVSTVGLVPKIRRLAEEGIPLTLAISLHAPDDGLRDRLVPVNRRWPIGSLLEAAEDYARITGRRVSVEYALIEGVNDSPAQAAALGTLLWQRHMHVNLIPMNAVLDSPFRETKAEDRARFQAILRDRGIAATMRVSRGRDIGGGCGQLAGSVRPLPP